ncbi:uncharacterized protein N7459_005200 [Penicillium hispanicum]|uniref:uncharacterized protein n=1 Tax=Penicillium hispanicum TaxID=1080232 RepID=UPI00254251B3|nr:uncharacterized protein N7459_005200 [Penicillium hispanicum]KAJ5585400.1 hypothetical protein N7459_005200 [Penicillium hispanicum]
MSMSNATNKVPMYGESLAALDDHHPNEAHAATVTYSDNDTAVWVAHANTTQAANAAFTTLGTSSSTNLLALGQSTESANPVGFTTSEVAATSQSRQVTDAWSLYGKYVLLSRANANFYAKPTGKDGWYSLLWSETLTSSVDNIPITLRTVGPATG